MKRQNRKINKKYIETTKNKIKKKRKTKIPNNKQELSMKRQQKPKIKQSQEKNCTRSKKYAIAKTIH